MLWEHYSQTGAQSIVSKGREKVVVFIKFPVFVCMYKYASLSFQQFQSCEDQFHIQFKATSYAELL